MEQIKHNSGYILGLGEIMLRLTPSSNQRIVQANSFDAQYSGAELNVIASLSLLGHKTKFITKLPNNYLGDKVMNILKTFDINTNDIIRSDGRLGIYYTEMGHGARSTEVIYDRKYSAISFLKKEEIDIEKVLKNVKLVHLSGITPALSEDLKELTIDICKYCNKNNIMVSYDSNYRSKLWGFKQAREVLEKVLPYVDFCFLGYLDMVNILEFEDNYKHLEFGDKLKVLYRELCDKYPNLKYVSSTLRTVNSTNNNSLRGYLFNNDTLFKSQIYTFDILDRVGAGDAFTAGILHGIIDKEENQDIVEFGTCASVLKHSIVGDINIIDENMINLLMNNGITTVRR